MKKSCFLVFIHLILLSTLIYSQTTKEEFFSDVKYASGVYQPYIYVKTPVTPAPEGYKPFYLSHYGRHGSRWLDSPDSYIHPKNVLSDALKANKLMEFGKSLCERVNLIALDAEERYGDLTPLGVLEHRGIAERMFYSFPEIFAPNNGNKCFIYSRSTVVPRCFMSMAANNERLKELNPEIIIERNATKKDLYLNNGYKHPKRDSVNAVSKNFIAQHFNVKRFMASVFTDTVYTNEFIKDPVAFVSEIYYLVADIQDVPHLKISMSDVFSPDDLFILWQSSNIKLYNVFTNKTATDSSKKLLKNILDCADKTIKNGNVSADLRFGHDSYIAPLLTLMDIKGMSTLESDPEKVYMVWSDFKVTPMAVNLQLIFYRNEKTDDVIVKLLHCEKEVEVPINSDIAPYYHWKDFKNYYEKKLAE